MYRPITTAPEHFAWATGIENTFVPQARPGLRGLDEYALTQHYNLWQSDYDRAADAGVSFARVGIPWYRIQPAPNRWDWTWSDAVIEYITQRKRITPILDLMHYGTPLWLEDSFLAASYPQRVAEFAYRATERYGSLIHYYTPLNEPAVNAEFCGEKGLWPPYGTGLEGYLQLIVALAKGIILTVEAIRSAKANAALVQVEALWRTVCASASPENRRRLDWRDDRQWLCHDLCTGKVGADYRWLPLLRAHGIGEADLAWLHEHAVRFDIFGANFYPWSYTRMVERPDGRLVELDTRTPGAAIGPVVEAAYRRYDCPIMITETSARRDVPGRAEWMDETVAAVAGLRRSGVPVVGYTWFPLFTMIDWAYRTGRRPLEHYLLHLGLYESSFDRAGVVRRSPTALVERFQSHIQAGMPAVAVPETVPTARVFQPVPEPVRLPALRPQFAGD
jgi:beta-glucosidase/6-phospho-beta-glucosidase/beta-galactosidase